MAGVGVTAVMVALEVVEVGVSTILKAAMDDGVVNQFVFIVYSNLLALPFISASCFLLYRKRANFPVLPWNIVFRILLLAIIGCFLQILLIVGVKYSSPTMNSAMLDLTPAYTFLLALLSRMEKLEYKSRSSQAKLIGTLVSIAGALMITLYKGQPIQTMKLHYYYYYYSSETDQTLQLEMTNWVIGGILCAAGSLCVAFGYIVMSWILKDYPEELMALSVSSVMGTTLCGAASLWLVHDPSAWTLRMDIGLLAIASNGVLCIALKGAVHAWALKKKGPVYVTMFKPLGMVAAMALGILFLGDSVFLGRVIGAVIIALGFYAAMWGKAQELEVVVEDHCAGECRVALLKD